MNDQYAMFGEATCEGAPRYICSPGEDSGVTPPDSQAGQTVDHSGPQAVPASPSALPVSARAETIPATCGPSASGSFASAGHVSSSANKSPLPAAGKLTRAKRCRVCGTEKPFDEFYTNSKGQRPGACKSCMQGHERHRKAKRKPELAEKHSQWRLKRRGYALVNVAKHRASKKGLECTLDPQNIQARIDRGVCEVSGIPFDLTTPRSWNAPSLDRISTEEGYTPRNTRVVIFSLNVMANVWGIQKVVEVANAISEQRTRPSDALQESLNAALKKRLNGLGSTLFDLTWKERVTPAGRPYLERQALARRTSVKGSTSLASWPTPDAHPELPNTSTNRGKDYGGNRRRLTPCGLAPVAMLASWPTPNMPSGGPNVESSAKHTGGMDLEGAATLASWCTPSARDEKDTPGMATTGTNPDGSERSRVDQLPRQAYLAAFGEMPSGFPAEFLTYPERLSGGLLNGAHSFWLQGIPKEWRSFVSLAMQSVSRSRKRSLKPTSEVLNVDL